MSIDAGFSYPNRGIERSLAVAAHRQPPGIGSPVLGRQLGISSLRTWRVDGLPLAFWYFERETQIDIARLVGRRQDALGIDVDGA